MLVLTWNLFHGRSVPDAPREQLADFAARLAGWEWDVALLQEVPPWWPPELGRACGASARTALTSRNWLLPLSRWAARRRPDVIKSWGGGANAMLVRGEAVTEHRVRALRSWPERRVVHGVRLERGWWVCNLHAQAHSEARAQADIALAAQTATAWSAGAPVVLGGDLNTRHPRAPGFAAVAGHSVDHVLVRSLRADGPGRTLDRGRLSDHVPVLAHVA
ncbi:MAG TPA: endonuclease/exonuclease/phosphatase family protein [Solirubrobacteraceae bacterium]